MVKRNISILIQLLVSVLAVVGESNAECEERGESCNALHSTQSAVLLQRGRNIGKQVVSWDCYNDRHLAWNEVYLDCENCMEPVCKDIFTNSTYPKETCQKNHLKSTVVGCFKKHVDDIGGNNNGHISLKAPHFIDTCMQSQNSLCLSGFPFYQWDGMSESECLESCIDKGLDLAAYFSAENKCRCGASKINEQIWAETLPKDNLLFDPSKLECSDTSTCELKVLRFTGEYYGGGINGNYNLDDTTYTDSIVAGRRVREEDTPEHPGNKLIQQPWKRKCWPGNCGPGNGPWKTRQTNPPKGAPTKWKDYVTINYWFEKNVDNNRKAAFRAAVKEWQSVTCINLIELNSHKTPDIKVGIYERDTCWLMGMGWPGNNDYSEINLGWCNSMRHKGTMIHEIGHALGMNHEQERKDGGGKFHSKGPHLKIYWQHIPNEWRPQYTGDANSYMGSADDGPGDPFSGYAPYDYGSIMHYHNDDGWFDPIPLSKQPLLGNREHLTQGDIDHILDVYQCIEKDGSPEPPTTSPECKDKHAKCTTPKWKKKCHKALQQKLCPLTCGKCDGGTQPTKPPTTCKDKNPKCPTKHKNKCHKSKFQKLCPLTCGMCTAI